MTAVARSWQPISKATVVPTFRQDLHYSSLVYDFHLTPFTIYLLSLYHEPITLDMTVPIDDKPYDILSQTAIVSRTRGLELLIRVRRIEKDNQAI